MGTEEKRRKWTVLIVVVLLLFLISGGAWLILNRPAPTYGTATVSDRLFAEAYDRTGAINVSVYLPKKSKFETLMKGVERPVISPDGRQLIFTRTDGVNYGPIVTLDSSSLKREWEAKIKPTLPRTKLNYSADPLWMTTAVTKDRIYAATQSGSPDLPITIAALDRASGKETARWTVDVGGSSVSGAKLFVSPDSRELYLICAYQKNASGTGLLYYRFRLPEGKLQATSKAQLPGGSRYASYDALNILNIRITPDGRTLYYFSGNTSSASGLWFFDLKTGEFEPPLRLPSGMVGGAYYTYEQAISRDGGRLYLLAPKTGRLAVVDLKARKIERVVSVGATTASSRLERALSALGDILVRPAAAKVTVPGTMQLSPNGRRLYAAGASPEAGSPIFDGIWAIDTRTWRIVNRWPLNGGWVSGLLLTDDGRRLYVQGRTLRVIDTKSGTQARLSGGPPYATLLTPSELYRQTYGKSPDAG